MKSKTVTIFGSSIPVFGEEQYEHAYQLGAMLGRKGISVCSGGNLGIMEAVSRGAVENGGSACGITLKNKYDNHNKYLTEHICCDTLFERITRLIENADAYIVLQGGTGTLLELAAIWEFMNKDMIHTKPAACHGKMWEPVIKAMEFQITLEKRRTGLIKYFNKIEECGDYIITSLENPAETPQLP